MADNVSGLPGRGQTLLSGAGRTLTATGPASKLEGLMKDFNDRDGSATSITSLRSQKKVTMMLVRNVSGIALAGRRVVNWAAGYRNRRVSGYCTVNFAEAAGVTDEFTGAAGIPNNDLFWLAVKGPALVKKSLAANSECLLPENTVVCALTAATSQANTAGRIIPFAATSDATNIGSVALNRIGRCISAATTSQTGGATTNGPMDILIDLEIQAQS